MKKKIDRRCNYPGGCGRRKGDCELYDPRECEDYVPPRPAIGKQWVGVLIAILFWAAVIFVCITVKCDCALNNKMDYVTYSGGF